MAQIKVYGERGHLRSLREPLSTLIHEVNQAVLGLPADKLFHRFIGLDAEDFRHPLDQSGAYTIIEISMFEGRAPATRRALLEALMSRIQNELGLDPADLEIMIFETPRANWAIRGRTGDALDLPYEVER
jgi:phenylpyruvate tautomerase PptA (4-oxalocrotonate tautomerase family)